MTELMCRKKTFLVKPIRHGQDSVKTILPVALLTYYVCLMFPEIIYRDFYLYHCPSLMFCCLKDNLSIREIETFLGEQSV